MIRDIHEVKECPDCGSDNIHYSDSRDQIICRDCGLIFEPLVPEDEETFESTHSLTMGGGSSGRAPKMHTPKPAKAAKPAKKAPAKKAPAKKAAPKRKK